MVLLTIPALGINYQLRNIYHKISDLEVARQLLRYPYLHPTGAFTMSQPFSTDLSPPQASPAVTDTRDWRDVPTDELIQHLLSRYHQPHREQLPELIRMARRVEQVHGSHPECPNGLADHLSDIYQALESHMLKEEQILFPMLLRGEQEQAQGPVSVMRFEHEQHEHGLSQLHELTRGIQPPVHACNTWRTLYQGLEAFCADLNQHIQLENELLFTRV